MQSPPIRLTALGAFATGNVSGDLSVLGGVPPQDGTRFSVWSSAAERIWLCLFDAHGNAETDRIEMEATAGGVFARHVPGLGAGARYGFRADGPYAPEQGLWFDPGKLLMDPYAIAIDRAYAYDQRLALRREAGGDTATLMPKAVTVALPEPVKAAPPLFEPGGLIYEVQVRAFTKLHPDIPEQQRGTIAALAHPAVLDHLRKLNVSAVELMPVTAWIDERHLPPLGLCNAWGYNPVSFMALDPRIAPGGLAELRQTVAALREAGIGVILDLVFNHTGESDEFGPTLSLRGLDNRAYYRHSPAWKLVNDTGTGNTLACDHPAVHKLVLDSLRHFVLHAGVDGFRFDLAPVLGRGGNGFDPDAPLLRRHFRGRSDSQGPHPDRRTLGYRAGRLPAWQFPAALPRMERPFPRRRPPLLAARPRRGRSAGHAARRFVRRVCGRRRPAPSISLRRMTALRSPTLCLRTQAQRGQWRDEPRRP